MPLPIANSWEKSGPILLTRPRAKGCGSDKDTVGGVIKMIKANAFQLLSVKDWWVASHQPA